MDLHQFDSLTQIGGIGVIAAMLFVLHRESIARFTKELSHERENYACEMKLEREACREQWQAHLDRTGEQHTELLRILAQQDKLLDRITRDGKS